MFKHTKSLIVLGLLVIVLGVSLAVAAEPTEQVLPWGARMMEILQKHPEVLEEIQALETEYEAPSAPEGSFFGRMRGWMGGPAHCWQYSSAPGPGWMHGPHHGRGGGWFR